MPSCHDGCDSTRPATLIVFVSSRGLEQIQIDLDGPIGMCTVPNARRMLNEFRLKVKERCRVTSAQF